MEKLFLDRVAKLVRDKRLNETMTRVELAKLAGVEVSFIRALENEELKGSIKELSSVLKVCGSSFFNEIPYIFEMDE